MHINKVKMVESITETKKEEMIAPEAPTNSTSSIEDKLAAYYKDQLVHERTIYSYERANVIREGDVVIFYERHDH